jgi:uncharacterized protein
MIVGDRITINRDRLAEICERYSVQELALFGSVLRDDFRADSDVDLLVSFKPGTRMSLFRFVELQEELEALFGRKVDLVSKRGLKPVIRDEVLASSHVMYAGA